MSRTYVVTGAASGIGLALAERITNRGDRVIGLDIRDAEVLCDLTDPDSRAGALVSIEALSAGVVDGVAAVAGLAAPTQATVAVNYFGAVSILEGLRPLLAASGAPRAAVVSSMAAIGGVDQELVAAMLSGDEQGAMRRAGQLIQAHPDGSAPIYSSSKNAVVQWVRANAARPEWAGAGIAVNAVAPGVVETPLMKNALSTAEGREAVSRMVPSPLNGPAPASAPAALLDWLLSQENTHVTGQLIFIDGGAECLARPAHV